MSFKKKIDLFLFYYGCLFLLEFSYMLLTFDTILRSSLINIILFLIPVAGVLTLITSLFKDRVNKILAIVIFGILGLWYNIYYVFEAIFDTFFSFAVFKLSDQGLKFASNAVVSILEHFYGVVILFVPMILIIIFKNKFNYKKINIKEVGLLLSVIVVGISLFSVNVYMQKNDKYAAYDLYFNINDNSLNIEKLGVISASFLDIHRTIFGFNEKIIVVDNNDGNNKDDKNNNDDIFDYGYNEIGIDYKELLNEVSTADLKTVTNYMINDKPTNKNKYTGIFKGKNLVYITAESFSEIAVSEELTPTLYKLVNGGFHFANYYSSNNLSTIGGEFQSLTGLYADSSILPTWRSGKNSFPYGLSNMFEKAGYNTYAYHNHYYTFQDRNKYLKSLGFDNFLGCYNGLEKRMNCKSWPESDIEMIDVTVADYIDSEKPFLAYYMTVSGHFAYNFTGNKMSRKNKDLVKDLPYSDPVKAYLATQIELDRALELLLNKLEEANVLDDTVIVLLCDHYPYGLTLDEINEVSTYKRDGIVEINSNNLIIWNSKMKKVEVDKVAMSIDVIPTVYNLFGLDYDSRLFMGKDIFSNSEGIAFFKNRSFVTEKGTYLANSNKMINTKEEVSQEYIDMINNIVANRRNISKLLIKSDYYKFVSE